MVRKIHRDPPLPLRIFVIKFKKNENGIMLFVLGLIFERILEKVFQGVSDEFSMPFSTKHKFTLL